MNNRRMVWLPYKGQKHVRGPIDLDSKVWAGIETNESKDLLDSG
jgi:hypothetical protein